MYAPNQEGCSASRGSPTHERFFLLGFSHCLLYPVGLVIPYEVNARQETVLKIYLSVEYSAITGLRGCEVLPCSYSIEDGARFGPKACKMHPGLARYSKCFSYTLHCRSGSYRNVLLAITASVARFPCRPNGIRWPEFAEEYHSGHRNALNDFRLSTFHTRGYNQDDLPVKSMHGSPDIPVSSKSPDVRCIPCNAR